MKATILLTVMTAATVAASAMARPPATPSRPSESLYCATREAGNPHSKYCDYMGWSQWRWRGGWDASLDNACLRDPGYIPPDCPR
jgi:hypothetical protein